MFRSRDATLEKIFKELADEFDLTPKEVEKIVLYVFRKTKDCMRSQEFPRILLHYFGSFAVPLFIMERKCRASIKLMQKGKTPRGRVYHLLQVRRRLKREYAIQRNSRKYTSKEIRKILAMKKRGVITKDHRVYKDLIKQFREND